MTPDMLIGIAIGAALMGLLDRTVLRSLAHTLATDRRRPGGR